MSFTPGPWKVGRNLGSRTEVRVIHHDAGDAGQGSPVIEGAVSPDDAKLIAAAPSMYAELKRLAEELKAERAVKADLLAALVALLARSDMEHWPVEQELALAAIAKAQG
jgi:hypothetical protein